MTGFFHPQSKEFKKAQGSGHREVIQSPCLFVAALAFVLVLGAGCEAKSQEAEQTPLPTGVMEGGSPPVVKVTKEEGRALLTRLAQVQLEEKRVLRRKNQEVREQLAASQKREYASWLNDSKKRVRAYRHEHRGNGKLVREFIKIERETGGAMLKQQAEKKKKTREELDQQRKSLQAFQEGNFEIFRRQIEKGIRPPESLWPSNTAPYAVEKN